MVEKHTLYRITTQTINAAFQSTRLKLKTFDKDKDAVYFPWFVIKWNRYEIARSVLFCTHHICNTWINSVYNRTVLVFYSSYRIQFIMK